MPTKEERKRAEEHKKRDAKIAAKLLDKLNKVFLEADGDGDGILDLDEITVRRRRFR